MYIPDSDIADICNTVGLFVGSEVKGCAPVSGGDINATFRLETEKTPFFLKVNTLTNYKMLEAECFALGVFSKRDVIRVPEVLEIGSNDRFCWLVLEYVSMKPDGDMFLFGQKLAEIHSEEALRWGWESDNYIGLTIQRNASYPSWAEFFFSNRLCFQVNLLPELRSNSIRDILFEIESPLKAFLEAHRPFPSLLHGDLWRGNKAFDANGHPVVFDMASYYGDREADVAFTELFGGFRSAFYQGYNDVLPLDDGYEIRKNIYNLYHLLNHENLFSGYFSQVERTLHQIKADLS